CWLLVALTFFFFQAEDGIRDRNVTGVQTCALPISDGGVGAVAAASGAPSGPGSEEEAEQGGHDRARPGQQQGGAQAFQDEFRDRSEERRVGKEGRCRGGARPHKKTAGGGGDTVDDR